MSSMMPALFAENTHSLKEPRNRRSGSQTMKVIVRVMRTRNNSGISAIVLLASDMGAPIREIRYDFSSISLEEAGLRASLESLKIAGRYRAKHVVIYIDNEHVASIANGTDIPSPDLIGLALQLRAFCHSFRSVVTRYGTPGATPSLLRLHKSGEKGQLSHVL
jgi:hypothetical protein